MNLTVLKAILMVVMLLMHLLGLIPTIKCNTSCCISKEPLSFLNCFAAGIFLSMALVHMLPEALEIHSSWAKKQKIDRAFPIPVVIFIGGYLLVMAFERAITSRYAKNHHDYEQANTKEIST